MVLVVSASHLSLTKKSLQNVQYVASMNRNRNYLHFTTQDVCENNDSFTHLFVLVLQDTRVLHASRRWIHVPPAPVTITGRATLRAPAPWGSAAAAQQASPARHVPSWWTSAH